MQPRVFYLTPDYDAPSWGVGMLYHHVHMLCDGGFDARVLLPKSGAHCPAWLNMSVPMDGLDDPALNLGPSDILVVPEVMAHDPAALAPPCRKVVFVQGSFLMLHNMPSATNYAQLGYEIAFAVMPHIGNIIADHFGVTPHVIPPFVAPYFFADSDQLSAPRARNLVMVGKPEYLKAGYLDYDIARKILRRKIDQIAAQGGPKWNLVEPSNMTHLQLADLLQSSSLMLNVNSLESFNATVPEAMAAGCIVTCYDAYGGQDFLRGGDNANVWPNNHIYPLLGQLCDLLETYDARSAQMNAMRAAAFQTALNYQRHHTANALLETFTNLTT